MSRTFAFVLLAAALASLPPVCQAQTSLPHVDVSARRAAQLRVDVFKVCPGYAEHLREGLRLPPVSEGTDMLVRFELKAGMVSNIGFSAAPVDYRLHIRRVMRQLDCRSDGQANQRFAFMLRHRSADEAGLQATALSPDAPLLATLTLPPD
ncbi:MULTISPECIES: hypothetical protein [unclassified Roseateles]|uniref:hypothetical protein n=1 Tax=unclassified Roseateles TaxID=2626991 RepID=UPI0006F99E0B|nr:MULTISPECIES: hypothetical protein [unclassified Roseateles]KQW52129.1 hypothetical protein ASC81_05910 [Pelomonas sp. Root405]KRA78363.1 hypothetical protein ASD88_05915 [Pelomonas sp. Root662]